MKDLLYNAPFSCLSFGRLIVSSSTPIHVRPHYKKLAHLCPPEAVGSEGNTLKTFILIRVRSQLILSWTELGCALKYQSLCLLIQIVFVLSPSQPHHAPPHTSFFSLSSVW